MELDEEVLVFGLLVEDVIAEIDQNDDFLIWLERVLEGLRLDVLKAFLASFVQGYELVIENVHSMFVHDEDVVRLSGLLGAWVELAEQILRGFHHGALMRGLFWRLTLVVALLQVTEACSDHELDGGWLSGPKCEVKGIVTN